ncbi:hypothetical protein CFR71_13530 [Novacetimonas pomaceti]|uniref:Uncharacterized protein n=1 Tax=Novacetimonas pomaceti TaxID=2021998 RepID=A0A318QA36_9PROT|nr:hypothetical protein CFR71_13530 [Novacetimonas pomaceti]
MIHESFFKKLPQSKKRVGKKDWRAKDAVRKGDGPAGPYDRRRVVFMMKYENTFWFYYRMTK